MSNVNMNHRREFSSWVCNIGQSKWILCKNMQ